MRRIITFMACCVLAACASLSKSYPDKSFYAFDVERGESGVRVQAADDAPLLLVKRFQSGPLNESRTLVYRTGVSTYESDYYNEFFSDPEGLLTVATAAWLSDSGNFAVLAGSAAGLDPDFVLHGSVRGLYVDMLPEDGPHAIVDLQLVLSRRRHGLSEPIWRKDFMRSELAASPSGADVMAAWNRGLADLFAELEVGLETAIASAE